MKQGNDIAFKTKTKCYYVISWRIDPIFLVAFIFVQFYKNKVIMPHFNDVSLSMAVDLCLYSI